MAQPERDRAGAVHLTSAVYALVWDYPYQRSIKLRLEEIATEETSSTRLRMLLKAYFWQKLNFTSNIRSQLPEYLEV